MYLLEPRPWDNLPQHLTPDEIKDPHTVINEYFDIFSVAYARKKLFKLLNASCKAKPFKHSASSLLFFYEKTSWLIEAAYLVNQMDNARRRAIIIPGSDEPEINLMNPLLFCVWFDEKEPAPSRDAWENFPRSLTYNEFLNPYSVFEKFFSFLSLSEWRQMLNEIFSMALSRDSYLDDGLDFDILQIRTLLEKLIDGSHLIDVREYRHTNYHTIRKLKDNQLAG